VSDLRVLYLLTFVFAIYSGYKEAAKLSGSLIEVAYSLGIGLIIGACAFVMLINADRIWVYANRRQNESLWAVVGVSYFLLCGLLAPVFFGIFTSYMVEMAITWLR
jgi:hypothetical protein